MTAVRLVILGRQGSGKGTQAARLVEAYDTVHISTGDMLRAAVSAETELGLQARAVMDAGELVGDDLINGIVAERLAQDDVAEHGFLLDGYPRTPDQAAALVCGCLALASAQGNESHHDLPDAPDGGVSLGLCKYVPAKGNSTCAVSFKSAAAISAWALHVHVGNTTDGDSESGGARSAAPLR